MPIPMPDDIVSAAEGGRGGFYLNVFVDDALVWSGLEPFRLQQQIQDLEAQIEAAEQRTDDLEAQLAVAEEELDADPDSPSSQQTVDDFERRLAVAEEERAALDAELDAARDQFDQLTAPFSVTDATIVQDMTRPIRRNMTARFTGAAGTVPSSLLSAWSPLTNTEIRAVWAGGGTQSRWLRFRVTDAQFSYDATTGVVSGTVDGGERMSILAGMRLPSYRVFEQGESTSDIVRRLIQRFDAGATVNVAVSGATLGSDRTFDPDTPILEVISELAAEGGFSVWTDRANRYQLRAVAEIDGDSNHTFSQGAGNVHSVTRQILIDDVVNMAVVFGDDPSTADSAPIRRVASIDSGPLSRNGPLGPRPVVRKITTNDEGRVDQVAENTLRRSNGLPHKVIVEISPNPTVTVGDTATVRFPALNVRGRYLVERVRYRMGDPTMTVECAERLARGTIALQSLSSLTAEGI